MGGDRKEGQENQTDRQIDSLYFSSVEGDLGEWSEDIVRLCKFLVFAVDENRIKKTGIYLELG